MIHYKDYIKAVYSSLKKTSFTDADQHEMKHEKGFRLWCSLVEKVKKKNGKIFIIGNGASAAMASHMTADATKNGRIPCMPLNDISMMTAVSNDISYDKCYAEQLKIYAQSNDLLITISSSGNSPNIIEAINSARKSQMKIITLSGMNPDNSSRKMGDLNVYVHQKSYGLVESSHQVIMHCWLDMYIENMKKKID